ncbi:hypothetical protein GOC46_28910 [Sinorhizobium meliloti]|nr:hypothetical protein [Sinorhizobium meliloti]MDX0384149.1 hypothetical protein [Sinorhizobium meliloti]
MKHATAEPQSLAFAKAVSGARTIKRIPVAPVILPRTRWRQHATATLHFAFTAANILQVSGGIVMKYTFLIASIVALITVAMLGTNGDSIAGGPCNPAMQTCL